MKLISINVGQPREVTSGDETVLTSIYKDPVSGPVRVSRLNLAGDRQSDLKVHGGVDKAVYAYPSEHYAKWRVELPDADLLAVEPPWGAFGENLSIEGLREDEAHIGDRLRIGSTEFVVTQPRMPCMKLALKFGRSDMIKRFLDSGRSGFYLSVALEGEIVAGDELTTVSLDPAAVTVSQTIALYTLDAAEAENDGMQELLRRAIQVPALPEGWRERFRRKLHAPA